MHVWSCNRPNPFPGQTSYKVTKPSFTLFILLSPRADRQFVYCLFVTLFVCNIKTTTGPQHLNYNGWVNGQGVGCHATPMLLTVTYASLLPARYTWAVTGSATCCTLVYMTEKLITGRTVAKHVWQTTRWPPSACGDIRQNRKLFLHAP